MSFSTFIPLLQDVGTGQSAPGTGSMLVPLITMGAIFLIFYFFIIRPQNKKQKETEKMIAALKKGDKVVSIGGIHGVVYSTKENSIIVKVDDGCKLEFSRSAISSVVADPKETSTTDKETAKEIKKEEKKEENK